MKTILKIPLAINHIGGRSNNEDSIFPLQGEATVHDWLFLVCDGVGGNEKGEVASRLACDKFAEYFANNPQPTSDAHYINEALKYTEDAFDQYTSAHEQAKGMGTTLTLLHFHDQGASIAHIGDSRVYQFRNGEIIHKTSDHSLVNDLLKGGIISEEQAKNHPRKNVISRAIQGANVKATKAEVKQITDIQPNDYFFMCTDGILENLSDFEISQILLLDKSNAEKMDMIQKRCEEAPNDNFSAYLIQIKDVEGLVASNDEKTVFNANVDESDKETIVEAEVQVEEPLPNNKSLISKLKKWGLVLIILAGLIVVYLLIRPNPEPNKVLHKKKNEQVTLPGKAPNKNKRNVENPKKSEKLKTNNDNSRSSSDQKKSSFDQERNNKPGKITLKQKEDDSINKPEPDAMVKSKSNKNNQK